MNILIDKMDSVDSFPIAHTCSKMLELPAYPSKEIMKHKIM